MTAPAAAPAFGPIAPPVHRPVPQAAADPFAFATVLDSLPHPTRKAGASVADEHSRPSSRTPQEGCPHGQPAHRFAASRRRAPSLVVVCFADRVDRQGAHAICGRCSFAPDNPYERAGFREQRRSPYRRRQKRRLSGGWWVNALFISAPPRAWPRAARSRSTRRSRPTQPSLRLHRIYGPTTTRLRVSPRRRKDRSTPGGCHSGHSKRGPADADRPSSELAPNISG